MFTSAADVFRTRQVVSDLSSSILLAGRTAFARFASGEDAERRLLRIVRDQGGHFSFPNDEPAYGETLLAAALPDEDFPAFTCATALLLLDRIQGGDGQDDLFWNWDAFADHYRMADPSIRAVLMNGFRVAAGLGRVSLAAVPDPVDCLTYRPEVILTWLRDEAVPQLSAAIRDETDPDQAAEVWAAIAPGEPSDAVLAGIRYLYERPVCMAPRDPHTASLIPWSL